MPDKRKNHCFWAVVFTYTKHYSINEKVVAKEKLEANTVASLAIMAANGITPPPNYGQNAGYTENCVPSYAGVEEKDTYWYNPDHLGSSSFITGLDGEVTQNIEYFPSGEVFVENHKNSYNTPYKFNGKEQDDETGYYYYGARYYNPRVSLWLNVDPLAEKMPSWSPYSYSFNNPVKFIDPDGRYPILPLVGTIATFLKTFNNTPSRMGTLSGTNAAAAMSRLGNTEFNWSQGRSLPTNTAYFNNRDGRYVYTTAGGWIDMVHFLFYAGRAYNYKLEKAQAQAEVLKSGGSVSLRTLDRSKMNPVGESLQDGYMQEASDVMFAAHSAYSYEDLPSDKFGAEFGANYFDPKSKLSFGEQLQNYMNSLGATDPKNAPNYNELPKQDNLKSPPRKNYNTKPVYIKGDTGGSNDKPCTLCQPTRARQ